MHNITQPVLPVVSSVEGSSAVLLTSDGMPVGNLSPQESAFYPTLFKIVVGNKAGQASSVIPAAVAASFLKRSGLSKKQLHDIWCLSDPTDSGYLTQEGFYKACRLVAHAQCGSGYVGADQLGMEPQSLPFFEGADGASGENVWKLSEVEIKRYSELFRREGGTVKLDGNDARGLLSRSGLSNSELCDIWDLADVDKDGKLTFGEFLVAMQLIGKVRDGKAFLPSLLPEILKGYLTTPIPEPSEPVTTPSAPSVENNVSFKVFPLPEAKRQEGTETPTFSSSIARPPASFDSHKDLTLLVPNKELTDEKNLQERELAEERKFVVQGIDRSRQFRKQVLDGRARLASLKEEAKKTEMHLLSADHSVEKIQDQILNIKQQISEGEEELDLFRRESGQVSGSDVLAAVSSIKESILGDEREVLELRMQLERVQREKVDLQSSLAVVKEKKRQSEQDRNMLIVGLENERAKLVAVRAERLQLWEQRHQLTRELTTKTFDKLNTSASARAGLLPANTLIPVSSSSPRIAVRDRKGVRADDCSLLKDQGGPWTQTSIKNNQWSSFG